MTEFSKLTPMIIAVSMASALSFASDAAIAGDIYHANKHHHKWVGQSTHVTPISAEAVKLNAALDQNQGGVVEGKRNRPDWIERINISGLINVDAVFSSRTPEVLDFTDVKKNTPYVLDAFGSDRSANDIALADANIFVDACVNKWTTTHVAFLFRDHDGLQAIRQFRKGDVFDPKDLRVKLWSNNSVQNFNVNADSLGLPDEGFFVDEAYITIGNLERSPFFLRAGRQYVPFGDYERYTMTDSFTKLLSMTSATALQAGYVADMGPGVFNGSVYAFRGLSQDNEFHDATDGKIRVRNWGAHVGYAQDSDNYQFNLTAGYLHNMADVDFISVGLRDRNEDETTPADFYEEAVGAYSLRADASVGPFDAGVRYVAALDEFEPSDVFYDDEEVEGPAKPKAVTVDLGYTFDMMNHHSRLGVTYQHSKEAKRVGPMLMGLPQTRWGVDYQINLLNRTDLAFELINDKDYAVDNCGSDHHRTIGTVRLSVAFA
jgi:hypothetical protein